MTTAEIFNPVILNGLFAVMGGFATLSAFAVKDLTIFDADKVENEFQKEPPKKGRNVFISFFMLSPFVMGAVWGLLHAGTLSQTVNEYVAYAIAVLVGMVANSMVIKMNGLSAQELIDIVKSNFPSRD